MIGYGIDLSHHQNPAKMPWDTWAGKVDFVMVRAAYGATMYDATAGAHVDRARAIGAKVGLYQFFRIGESVDSHLATLHEVMDACRIDDGDIVPALDIEGDPVPPPGKPVQPSWSGPTEELVGRIVETWGNCLVYITQREWHLMGSPSWVLRRPLWTAHYTPAAAPATPGGLPATIWQHRVGTFDPSGPGGFFQATADGPQVDQNRLLAPLPLVGQVVTPEERDRVESLIALTLSESAQLEKA